jgi:hypothetical protein
MIGIPFNHGMDAQFHLSVTNLGHHLSTHGWDVDINYAEGSLLSTQRNRLAKAAIARGHDLLFIDSDITFTVPAALKIISSPYGIVGGLYYARRSPYHPLVFKEDLTEEQNVFRSLPYKDLPEGPFLCKGLGTGFLRIKHDTLKYLDSHWAERQDRLFNFMPLPNGDQYGEDLSFFRRCNLTGIDVWCDPTVDIGHLGTQVVNKQTHVFHTSKDWHYCNDFEGWMTVRELNWLYEEAKKVSTIAEVGSWKGRSTHALLSGCPGTVYAVDTWEGSESERQGPHKEATERDVFEDFMRNCGKFSNLVPIRAKSLDAAKELKNVDMVFIDASHDGKDVLADISAWEPKAEVLVCGHDYTGWPGVQWAVNECFGVNKIETYDSIWFVRK